MASHRGSRPFFSEAELRPHKSPYWLTSKDKRETPEQYQADVETLCETKPVRPGLVERVEFEYIRHGTLCLIANFNVVTGKIVCPSIGPTRTEADFVAHIDRTIATDPQAGWIFVADQLDTHVSATLVQLVAQRCAIEVDRGVTGKRGVLKSKKSRRKFLQDTSHRIRFVYTPRHCSWLNQIEIWFSILARRLLKRSSFMSLDDLRDKTLAFIEYFNKVLGKPFRWTYTGRPLQS